MRSHIRNRLKLFFLLTVFILLPAAGSFCLGSELQKSDAAKRETGRTENFLLRTYEELSKSLEYEKAAIDGLENSERKDAGMQAFVDWHRSYAAWIKNRIVDTESDLENFYSGKARRIRINRYPGWAADYDRFKEQANDLMALLDRTMDLNAAKIKKLSAIVEYREYMIEQAKIADEKRKPDRNPPEDWFIYSRDLDDEKIKVMLSEIALLRDSQKGISLLLDLERYEAEWIRAKSGDSEALAEVADALMDHSLDRFEEAADNAIKQYESDITLLEKNLKEIDGKRGRLDSAGITVLDSSNAYDDYCFIFKTRLQHHQQWLKEQIGGFRADIVLLAKERRR